MTFCKIHHMNIIPDAGTIGCRIIIAEDGKLLILSDSHPGNKRHQIVGNSGRIFTNQPRRMCSNRIEVTQQNNTPFRIGRSLAFKYFFDHEFCPAIGIGTTNGNHIFPIGNRRLIAVNCCG